MDCLDQLRVGPLCKMDQSLFTENLLLLQIGRAKYAQSTLESDLTRTSIWPELIQAQANNFCRSMQSIYVG
jgi:hypothetical protein